MNICMRYRLIYRDLHIDTENERVLFTCTLYTAGLLKETCEAHGIAVQCDKRFGLPELLRRYRRRYGIPAGIMIAAAIVIVSGRYLWDVRVNGCERISADVVEEQLAAYGLHPGTRISDADIDVIENSVLIASEDIAWISVNLNGSVAFVEIREKHSTPEEPEKRPANIVASRDGQIESIEAYSGVPVVKAGQHVRCGELLVSGVYDSAAFGYRYTRARGEVRARTVREIRVEIPLTYEEKQYTGKEYSENMLIFFSKEIKLYGNTGFLVGTYDTICTVDNFCLFDGTPLPAAWRKITYLMYEQVAMTRSPDEAMELAYSELEARTSELIRGGAVMLRKNLTSSLTDTSYILDCTLTLIEDIADTVEFEIDEQ